MVMVYVTIEREKISYDIKIVKSNHPKSPKSIIKSIRIKNNDKRGIEKVKLVFF